MDFNFQFLCNRFKIKDKAIIFIVFLIVLLANCFFSYTYPLNVGAYDNINYLSMISNRESNLMHASGYPFLIITIFDLLGVVSPGHLFDAQWGIKDFSWYVDVANVQLALHVFLVFVCGVLSYIRFGLLVSSVLMLLWGGHVLVMGSVGSSAPEWLQGDLLLCYALLCFYAYGENRKATKAVSYFFSAVVFTASYFVKYNSILLLPLFFIVLLLDDCRSLIKFSVLIGSGALSVLMSFLFIEQFHFPTTQSRQFHFDNAWVMTAALPGDYFKRPVEVSEINALRWRALTLALPPDYFRAAAFSRIDAGAGGDERVKFNRVYEKIMEMSLLDLRNDVSDKSLPVGFTNTVSSIPLYWYLGLPKTDALGMLVFKEALINDPLFFVKKAAVSLFDAKVYDKQITPFYSNSLGLNFSNEDRKGLISSLVSFSARDGRAPHTYAYWNTQNVIWKPGVIFFEKMNAVTNNKILELFCLVISLAGGFFSNKSKAWNVWIILVIGVFGYLFASGVFAIRHKEILSIFPIFILSFSLGLNFVFQAIKKLIFGVGRGSEFFNSNAIGDDKPVKSEAGHGSNK